MTPTDPADPTSTPARRPVGPLIVANVSWIGASAALAVAGWVRSRDLEVWADADESTSGWLVPAAFGVGLFLLTLGIVAATVGDPRDRFDPKAVVTPIGIGFVALGLGEIAAAYSRDADPKLSSWLYVSCGLLTALAAELLAARHRGDRAADPGAGPS